MSDLITRLSGFADSQVIREDEDLIVEAADRIRALEFELAESRADNAAMVKFLTEYAPLSANDGRRYCCFCDGVWAAPEEQLNHLPTCILSKPRPGASLLAELAKLREIVDRLPKTADGVPVVPGMTVWWAGGSACDRTNGTCVCNEDAPSVTLCYSTRAAAESAKGGGK